MGLSVSDGGNTGQLLSEEESAEESRIHDGVVEAEGTGKDEEIKKEASCILTSS